MEKTSLEELITKEKEENPKCKCCEGELVFDMISGKFLCAQCDHVKLNFTKGINKDRRISPYDIQALKQLPAKSLINIIILRESKYNYLYNTWSLAAKGDRRAEFFLNRMKEGEHELDNIKRIGAGKVVNEERLVLIKKVNQLKNKISDIHTQNGIRTTKRIKIYSEERNKMIRKWRNAILYNTKITQKQKESILFEVAD